MAVKKSNIDRRDLLKSGVVASATLAFSPVIAAAKTNSPFHHGVASGDPLSDRVILWTRLTLPAGQRADEVKWQVATDKGFNKIIRQGTAKTNENHDWTIKIDCDGLKPNETYYYRFRHKEHRSPVGRTRTLPQGRVEQLKLAVASCANYNAGWFTAYRGIAARDDINAVIHLGDYIYEYANHVYGDNKSRPLTPLHETVTLDDYRARYAHYRSDPDLQACHARHPFIVVWDDHEIANNSWMEGAENHHPEKEGVFSERQLAGRQAYFEWLPIRPRDNGRIYRRFAFGDLAHLIMIDTRHDGRAQNLAWGQFIHQPKTKKEKPRFDKKAFLSAFNDKRRRMISRAQELWLRRALRASAREARWTLIGNQVNFTPVAMPDITDTKPPKLFQPLIPIKKLAEAAGLKELPFSFDSWTGYPTAQKKIEAMISAAGNPTLILTGDTHHGWTMRFGGTKNPIGTELGGPGITSPGLESYASKNFSRIWLKKFRAANPRVQFIDGEHRGFMVVEVMRDKARSQWIWADVARRAGRLAFGPALEIDRKNPGRPKFKKG